MENSSEYVLNYASAIKLDKIARKRPKKLQCRPGFEQRGAACQKINRTIKPGVKSAGGGIVKNAAKLAIGAALVSGAGIVAAKRAAPKNPEPTPESIKEIISTPQYKPYLKAAAIAGVSTATIAGAIAVSPFKDDLLDRTGLNNDLYKKASEGSLSFEELTEAERRGVKTLKKVINAAAPKTSPSGEYTVVMDSASLVDDVRAQYKKNQADIKKLPKGDKKRTKLENQQSLLYSFLVMEKNKKMYDPGITVMGFRDKDGKLVGLNAVAPHHKYQALEFSGFVVFDGAPVTAAKDIMATNKEFSQRLGMEGKMVGQPFEEVKPLYKRYGAKPIPGTENDWIFEGDKKKDSLIFNFSQSRKTTPPAFTGSTDRITAASDRAFSLSRL